MVARWRKFMVGTGKSRAGFLGMMDSSVIVSPGVQNVGGGETVLQTVKIFAGTLYKNVMGLYMFAFGTTAANNNNKTWKLYLNNAAAAGGFTLYNSGAIGAPSNNTPWMVDSFLFRFASKQQLAWAESVIGATVTAPAFSAAGAQDDTVDLFIVLTGQGVATGDILSNGLVVEPATL